MELATKGDQDRISQLPDPILHHILSSSFLGTKHAVRTCVLSKRWTNVWKSMPNLSFWDDDWGLHNENEGDDYWGYHSGSEGDDDWGYYHNENEEMVIDFPTFVNTVLLLRDTLDVHSLHIRWSHSFTEFGCDSHLMTTWVQYAVNHNVKKLEISLLWDSFDGYEFPRCVFTCPTLEDLVLSVRGSYADLPEVVHLGRLRKLHIRRFVSRRILLKSLIFGCPVLEDLHLEGCELEDPDISSNSIKKLDFEDCVFVGTRIRIFVPSLQSLEISGNDTQGIEVLLENLSSLVKASFQTENYAGSTFVEYEQELLMFTSPTTKDGSREVLSELQSFNRLQKLKLQGWSMVESFPTVVHFLKHSPNLELLTLEGRDSLSTSEKWFVCSHRKLYVVSQCGAENAKIFELMTDFFNSKCGCFR